MAKDELKKHMKLGRKQNLYAFHICFLY